MANLENNDRRNREQRSSRQEENDHKGGERCPDGVWRSYSHDSEGNRKRLGRYKNGTWVPYDDDGPAPWE